MKQSKHIFQTKNTDILEFLTYNQTTQISCNITLLITTVFHISVRRIEWKHDAMGKFKKKGGHKGGHMFNMIIIIIVMW